MKRWGKRLLWTLGGIAVLLLLLRLSLKTALVQDWVKDTVVTSANEQIRGELTIGELSGDLWKEMKISNLYLKQNGDSLAAIDSINVAYNIWALAGGTIDISELDISHPNLKLHEEKGRWNIQDLLKESADTTSGGMGWAIDVNNFQLHNGILSVKSDSLLPLDSFMVKELGIASSGSYNQPYYNVNLRDLSFKLYQSKLSDPLQVATSASVDAEKLSLEKLVLATSRTMIQSSGSLTPGDSTGQLNVEASPISWKDIVTYAEGMPLRENILFSIGLEGSPEQLKTTLDMQAEGLQKLTLTSQLHWDKGIVLEKLSTDITNFDPAILFADTTLPALAQLNANFSGSVPFGDYQSGYGALQVTAHDINYASYNIDQLKGDGKLNDANATFDLELKAGEQKLAANFNAERVWSDFPIVGVQLQGDHFNPGYWTGDTTYAGDMSFNSEISGEGWYPQEQSWDYFLRINNSQLMGQPISEGTMEGQVSGSDVSLDGRFDIREGELTVMTEIENISQTPAYNYRVKSRKLDIAALMGIPDFPTAINARVSGKGEGNTIGNFELDASVDIDSSLVNGELLRNFSGRLALKDTVAIIDSTQLKSTIAEGSLKGRINVLRKYDSENELTLALQLKDMNALAPLTDVEDLAAQGRVDGRLRPVNGDDLQFMGTFDFTDATYGQLFAADRAKGALNMRMHEGVDYKLNVDLEGPIFSGFTIQDLGLQTQGAYSDSLTNGQFDLQFSSPNEGRIEQSGEYKVATDSIRVRTREYNIISDYRMLSLEAPFDVTLIGDTLRMEKMRVSSGDGAFFEMAIPVLNANRQEALIHGKSLNTAVVQSCLLGKTFFKGLLSGRMEFVREDTMLNAQGQMVLSDVEYKETSFDTLLVNANITDERLQGDLSVRHDKQELITGKANLPFQLGDPENLPVQFFDEPVSGTMNIRKISIDRFSSIFAEAGITNTTGLFSFRGTLDGKAGNPRFAADATLSEAILSGVSVDSVTAGLDYSHDEEELELDASVSSLQQKAAEIDAKLPFYINMRTFKVDLPGKKDSISVEAETNNFNLAAVNDFLDRRQFRKVKGELNGSVQVTGVLEDLKADGQLVFRNGSFRIVPAGITVRNVQSTLNFEPDRIQLEQFSAKSDKGTMSASGKVELMNMRPGAIDIDVKGQNFRIANTDQYNAVINLDAHAEGKVNQPKISGNLDFVSGFLQLQNFGEKSVETVQLDTLAKPEKNVSIYDSLALDMNVSFDRRFYIRNKRYLDMEIELDGGLDLVKEKAKSLDLFGTITTPSGYARPFGKRFNLEEGEVTFSGDPMNPELMIRTKYKPPQTQEDITIWYIIEGTVENPKFKYKSRPTMQLENIISYTIFGQPFYALNSWKQVVAGSGNASAANVALDVLLDRVGALATKKLGIDVVKIDNIQVGEESGTQITTGWYLNPKVFLAIQNVITGSTPDTSFLLEYMLREDLKLLIRQGNGIRQGIDLKWNFDY
ncbi:hypothetical protein G3569_04725 [Aliifodinibius halophilus]|uniref:Translocation and assembly module TamB C-terminal domain-containing protein n=1 Tax=Fodinibius halophilus TaxID=1736908 RepID=A0A6M1SUJ9_9BACT|nr:hypothetical protein [Fodinibius halophilus]